MNRQETENMVNEMVAKRAQRYSQHYFQSDQQLRSLHRVGWYDSLDEMERENAPTQQTGAIHPISGMFKAR